MTVWMSGGGTLTKEEEAQCLTAGVIPLGSASYPDFTTIHSISGLKSVLRQRDADAPPETLNFQAMGLWRFVGEMELDDVVVLRLPHHAEVLIAVVDGAYHYVDSAPEHLRHQRSIRAPFRIALGDFLRRVPFNFPGNAMWYAVENPHISGMIRSLGGVAPKSLRAKIAAGAMAILLLSALIRMMMSTFGG